MQRKLLAIAILLLGAAALAAVVLRDPLGLRLFGNVAALAVTVGAMLLVVGVVMFATAIHDPNSPTWLRLDHFLPFLRKKKKAETLKPPALLLRIAQRVLPASLFADRITGKPGLVRRVLKRIGPTMLSAPLRRVVQAICFVLFLWLFFYALWPYSARPETPGQIASGWKLEEIDAAGQVRLAGGMTDVWQPAARSNVHLIDNRALDAIRGDFGPFKVVALNDKQITLAPREPLGDEQLESLLTSVGTWSIHEKSPWPSHYADHLARKEFVPAELFLVIDPLVSLSTAIASRSWVWSLVSAAMILIVCVVIPRGFCGYLCPLGTLIDLFDWAISKRVTRFRVEGDGWWVHIKYYLLSAVLLCAVFGVLVSGYVAAIPVITRGMLFLGDPLQSGTLRGFEHLPPMNWGHLLSIVLFFTVLGLGFLKPRFWCKYVCPSGAVFSIGNLFRVTDRKVESSCIHCNKCVEICPFDAIKPDFTTRETDCTLCQTCAGVCPTQAIKFVDRWNLVELKDYNDPPTQETKLGRRGFVSLAAGTAAAIVGGAGLTAATSAFGARLSNPDAKLPIRPPGSLPEQEFLQACIRCGECFKACPYNVLQPLGFEQGLEGLWTPHVVADHAGCAPSCNNCGQVCPTGAIRALVLAEKKVARMGLAIVNEKTCLPYAGTGACQACVDECTRIGYHAIEFTQVGTELDDDGEPIEGTGFVAPVVLADRCVGCGMCQMECHRLNVDHQPLLKESAIIIEAGEGKEDRLMSGSYRELRAAEARERRASQPATSPGDDYFVPGGETTPTENATDDDDPFGLGN